MIHREIRLRPAYIYPDDDWKLIEKRFDYDFMAQNETIFAVGNGYLGMRGNCDEGSPVYSSGTYINGFLESWPIYYPEEAFGFAKTGQTILNVTDGKVIRLYVDDEPFYLPTAVLGSYERVLDMQAGTLDREVVWETAAGKRVLIQSRRFVSFEHRHLAAVTYRVTVLNAAAPVVISSELVTQPNNQPADDDPRKARGFKYRVLMPHSHRAEERRMMLSYVVNNSKMSLACGCDHIVDSDCEYTQSIECEEYAAQFVVKADAQPGKAITITKFIAYHSSRSPKPDELCQRAARTLDRVMQHGLERILAGQRQFLDDFWRRSDVVVESPQPRAQQSIRWNLFQLIQAAGRAEGTGVPAKGLTGRAYEGHYFWDTEVYVLPFLIYTAPRIAKNLLKFRHHMLNHARQRARDVNQKGALFPWRTINGEEASAFYAAGTAQYHINADIAFMVKKYVEVTGDTRFLWEEGAEMLVETARLWCDIGFYAEKDGRQYCIHGVTGPDEYNTVVNNNTYTNLMARENLRYAAATVTDLRDQRPADYAALSDKTGLDFAEVADWQRAADNMYIPYDEEMGIHPQDDNFLEREKWDFENTPQDKYPLLLHHHPLVIYRHQVIKQPDVVLAMFLLGREFTAEEKKRNFDYYDPLTTGDSSLAACIQSIMAFEVGYKDRALKYITYAALMDLADVGANVKDGAHIASMGGTWMAMVYGGAGMRDYGGKLSFNPRLPDEFARLRFPITVQGQVLEIDVGQDSVTYLLREGEGLAITHIEEPLRLEPGKPVTVKCWQGDGEKSKP